MKITLKELLNNLGLNTNLPEYDSDTHQYRDDEKGQSCSAEIYMGGEQSFIEVEIQRFMDDADTRKPSVEQVLSMKGKPKLGEKWTLYDAKVKGDPLEHAGWEQGACAFYTSVVLCLDRNEMPDIEALIDEHLQGEGGFAGRAKRGGGRKNPKFKPPKAGLGMKQGM